MSFNKKQLSDDSKYAEGKKHNYVPKTPPPMVIQKFRQGGMVKGKKGC